MKKYYAAVDTVIDGTHYKKGMVVGEMTDRQAKYLRSSGQVTDVNPRAKAEAKDVANKAPPIPDRSANKPVDEKVTR